MNKNLTQFYNMSNAYMQIEWLLMFENELTPKELAEIICNNSTTEQAKLHLDGVLVQMQDNTEAGICDYSVYMRECKKEFELIKKRSNKKFSKGMISTDEFEGD